MGRSLRNIIAILVISLPFYGVAIFEKISGTNEVSVKGLFGEAVFFTILGLLIIFLLNKFLLKNDLRSFQSGKGNWLLDVAIALLLLIIIYFVTSIGNLTYAQWWPTDVDRTEIMQTLNEVFSNKWYILFFIGPFIWITEGFMALSRVFLLNNFWELSSHKTAIWISILFTALLCALTQYENGISGMINWFIIYTAGHFIYLKYKRALPLIITGILFQTIELVSFWIYVHTPQ